MRTCKASVSLILLGIAASPALALAAGDEKAESAPAPQTVPAEGAPAAPAPTPEGPKRPAPPVPARKYLETAARLYNTGRYDLAGKYLDAAHKYREGLSRNECVVLDVYREEYKRYLEEVQKRASDPIAEVPAPSDAKVSQAKTAEPAAATAATLAPVQPPQGALALRGSPDPKQSARWLLHQAREQIMKRQFDAARESVARASTFDVKFNLVEDSPKKVAESLVKAEAEAKAKGLGPIGAPGAETAELKKNVPHDRKTAKTMLREARQALAAAQVDKAEAIVKEVRSWKLRYGMFDDTPDKIEAALDEVRRIEEMRKLDLTVRSYMRPATLPKPATSAPSDSSVQPASGPVTPTPVPAPPAK